MHLIIMSKMSNNKLLAKKDKVALVQLCNISMQVGPGNHPFVFSTYVFHGQKKTMCWIKSWMSYSSNSEIFCEPTEMPPK